MHPPPAETFAARFFLGPALRSQPDKRLVSLVREGYESAFEEIVRRYGAPLGRYARAIVGGRAEDITQDAFSKALLALRSNEKEIELRPWLYRIVRNTALNDLRDRPPTPEALAEAIEGGRSAAEEVERREELRELVERLRALPEPQRAAIVMRELEGLSHAEIAAALGVSGGGARQAIHRARQGLRNAAGALVPLPLLKALLAGGTMAPAEMAAGAAGVGGVAGAGVVLKAATATMLVAGAVGAGVAIHDGHRAGGADRAMAMPGTARSGSASQSTLATDEEPGNGRASEGEAGNDREPGDDHGGEGSEAGGDHGGGNRGPGGSDNDIEDADDHGGLAQSPSSGHSDRGPRMSEGGGDDRRGPSSTDPAHQGGGPGPSEDGGHGDGGGGNAGSGQTFETGGGPGPSGDSGPGGGGDDEIVSSEGSGSGSGEESGSGSGPDDGSDDGSGGHGGG